MIDIGKILKRAWHILWNYKVLWIFGILMVMAGAGGGGGGNGGGSGSNGFNGSNGYRGVVPSTNPNVQQANQWFVQNIEPLFTHPDQHIATFVWIGVGLFLFILIVSLLLALVRYPTETAVIRMVDAYEQTGEKVRFKQGWKMGWNRRAFRMWVIDLVIGIPAFLLVAVLGGLGLLVYLSVQNGSQTAIAGSVVATIGCAFLFILAFMFKRNWKSGALMWLVMLGIGIGYGIVSLIIFFLLIPAYIVLAIPAVIVAVIPGLIVFGITSIFASGPLAWILGLVAFIPFFFIIVFLPLTFVGGLYLIFEYNVWTLTYREMKALESVTPVATPEIPEKTS